MLRSLILAHKIKYRNNPAKYIARPTVRLAHKVCKDQACNTLDAPALLKVTPLSKLHCSLVSITATSITTAAVRPLQGCSGLWGCFRVLGICQPQPTWLGSCNGLRGRCGCWFWCWLRGWLWCWCWGSCRSTSESAEAPGGRWCWCAQCFVFCQVLGRPGMPVGVRDHDAR